MDHLARSSRNYFSGLRLDRAHPRRFDKEWLEQRYYDPDTRLVPIWRMHGIVCGAHSAAPLLLTPEQVAELAPGPRLLLGTLGSSACFAVDLDIEKAALFDRLPAGAELCDLPDAGVRLNPQDGALLAYARGLTYWHRRHRHCGDCGNPNAVHHAGHMLQCTDASCGARTFPRTDPAVIVLVEFAGGPAPCCLLGRSPGWPPRTYSALAGFVEPGESLEDAVLREVREESGVSVTDVRYHSSQPWPFPASLMLGFQARALGRSIELDRQELEDARWFTRAELVADLNAGRIELPRCVSIAYRLVEDWFDAAGEGRLEDVARVGVGG